MTPFEDQLKAALARREPPEGFAERVLSRMEELPRPRRSSNGWRLALAAAAIFALISGAAYHEHERHVRGEEAKQKLMLALHIASSKLQQTQQKVNQVETDEVMQ